MIDAKSKVNLRKRILSSIGFSTLQFMSQIGLKLVSTIVLTRLLAPEIYGIFAVVLLYRYLLEMFSDLGIRSVVLTKENELDEPFLQTCWTVSLIRGLIILALSCLIGAIIYILQRADIFPAESAYASAVLPLAIAALGGVSVISALQTTNRYVYERNMDFGHVTIATVLSNTVGLFVTIGIAWFYQSVWALVIGAYVQWATLSAYSYLAFKGARMRLCMNRDALKIIIERGKWIIGHSALTALSQAADRLVLGFALTSSVFGFYYIARQMVELGTGFLNAIHTQMGLQVFTRIMGEDPETFRQKYYRYRLFFDSLAGLAAGGVLILAPKLVDVVFDDRYSDVGPFVQLLVLSFLPIGSLLLREAYSAERKFKEMTGLSLVSTVTLWVGLLIAVSFDNTNAALVVIALHRLPEALILCWLGAGRQWLVIWREGLVLAFMAIGLGCGWIVLQVWENLA